MRKLNDYEKELPNEQELISYWLDNGIITCDNLIINWLKTGRITCSDIIQAYTYILNIEKLELLNMLNQADMFTSTLIDGKKKSMDFQRPRAIEYILKYKRFEGSQWYKDLEKINVESDYEHNKNL